MWIIKYNMTYSPNTIRNALLQKYEEIYDIFIQFIWIQGRTQNFSGGQPKNFLENFFGGASRKFFLLTY